MLDVVCRAFREMLQQQLAARSSEAEPEEDDHTDQRLPLGAPSLPLLPRASGPAKASSALGELGSGQGSGPLPGALPGRGSAVHAQQGGPPRLLQQGSGGLPYRSGSLPSQRSGSVHMQVRTLASGMRSQHFYADACLESCRVSVQSSHFAVFYTQPRLHWQLTCHLRPASACQLGQHLCSECTGPPCITALLCMRSSRGFV